jgi:voltage-gated potassium channel Kch
MTLVDGENFPSIGSGLWWAVQTVTTVGYGDDVPTNLTGRLVAVLVMLVAIAFLTVITASITSTFVSRAHRERTPPSAETATAEQVRQLDSRLEGISDPHAANATTAIAAAVRTIAMTVRLVIHRRYAGDAASVPGCSRHLTRWRAR